MIEEEIKDTIIELKEKFSKIRKLGYVKGIRPNCKGNVGLTFESILGKQNDDFQIPDYYGIEIKTKSYKTSHYIYLFSLVPTNSFGIELKRLRKSYGWPDKDFKNINILNTSVFANKKTYLNSGYFLNLKINYNEKRLYLYIYDKLNNLVDKSIYWDFDEIIGAIERKLKNIALIKSRRKKINNVEFFSYTDINFYKLKSPYTFFKLLEKGYIRLNFCLSVYKSGPKIGMEHDHGIIFGIRECDLLMLYDEISI